MGYFPCPAFSMLCIFHVVHFPFFCFPVVAFLSFSGVCIFYLFPCCTFSISHFLVVIFCHFPVCAFSTFFMLCIFHVVHFPCHAFSMLCIFHVMHFLDVIVLPFSILSISSCDFSVIIW